MSIWWAMAGGGEGARLHNPGDAGDAVDEELAAREVEPGDCLAVHDQLLVHVVLADEADVEAQAQLHEVERA